MEDGQDLPRRGGVDTEVVLVFEAEEMGSLTISKCGLWWRNLLCHQVDIRYL